MAEHILILTCLAASVSSLPLLTQKYAVIGSHLRHNTSKDRILPFTYYSKVDWGGMPATSASRLSLPVPLVVIHHTHIPTACFNAEECNSAMRGMQTYHQQSQGWSDIGYNFAIGSDGAVYEGRGWSTVGAHAVGVNVRSIGITFIGDYISDLPPPRSLQAAKDLITIGVELGFISPSYHVIGHRQAVPTECPGESLYTEISSWNMFLPHFNVCF